MEITEIELNSEARFEYYFPEEIISNILIRLPTKSLVKCTSVCKSWKSLIQNPSFIGAHLSHRISSDSQDGNHVLLVHSVCSKRHCRLFDRDLVRGEGEDYGFDEYCKIEFPSGLEEIIMLDSCYRVVGTCDDGLVCVVDDFGSHGYNLVVWNPCIPKAVSIPEPPAVLRGGYEVSLGFGYDATGSDYKLVRLITLSDQCECLCEWLTLFQVYLLARGSWSSLCSDLPPCQVLSCPSQAFVNGALHWSAMGRRNGAFKCFVLAFDVSSELFCEIMLPKSLNWDPSLALRISVSEDGKSIAVFTDWCKSHTDYFLDIWEMKECLEKSWSKSIILSAEAPPRNLLEALCLRKMGDDSNGSRNARSSIEECGSAHTALDEELLEALFCVHNKLERVPKLSVASRGVKRCRCRRYHGNLVAEPSGGTIVENIIAAVLRREVTRAGTLLQTDAEDVENSYEILRNSVKAINAFSEGNNVRADKLIEKDIHLARGSLTSTSSYKELRQQYGGQVIANREKVSYCGTTILAFVAHKDLFIGADTKGSFRWGSMLYAHVTKVHKLAHHITAAWAGNGQAALDLLKHLKERIREYSPTQGSHVPKDIAVQTVASLALTYLRNKNQTSKEGVKVSLLVAGFDSRGLARIFKIDLKYRFPQPCNSLVLGSGHNAAEAILDPRMTLMRRSITPEDAKTLAMDSLIAASVADPHTGGDELQVYQMTVKDGLSLVLKEGVQAGYKNRITHLNLKPETENCALFCLTVSERFVSEQSLFNFFRKQRVTKCINLGCTINGRVIYRVVFNCSNAAAAAYARSCYEYERDVRREIKKGRGNPYDPFLCPLEKLEVRVRWVNVLRVAVGVLVCYLHPLKQQEQLRVITEVPVQYWQLRSVGV